MQYGQISVLEHRLITENIIAIMNDIAMPITPKNIAPTINVIINAINSNAQLPAYLTTGLLNTL